MPDADPPAVGGIVTSPISRKQMGWGGDNLSHYRTAYRDAAPVFTRGQGNSALSIAFRLNSGNKEIVRERRQAVINAREVDRNNTMIRAGITKRAVDMVGAQLRLQAMPNFAALGLTEEWADEFGQARENLFSLWGDDPRKLNDAERHSNFGPMMLETCRNCYGADGEAAVIIRYNETRMAKYRGDFASFVEVVDPDRISNEHDSQDTETLCQGRELDQWGAYTALWIETRHPSDPKGQRKWERVVRETANGRPVGVHWFPRFRAGAQRAMPAIIGSLRDVRMLDTFDNKKLEKAVLAAFMSIFIKTDATSAEALAKLSPAPAGATDPFMTAMNARFGLYEDLNAEGQALPVLAPGDEIKIATAESAAGGDDDTFRFAFERKFASMLGLSYARFSNDYSKTSFASIRAEFIDAWRMTYADRYAFCSSVPAQIALAVLEENVLRKQIILPANAPYFYDAMTAYAQCEFRGPGMGWVDPVKDVTGASLRVAGGFSNPQAESAAQGSDFRDNIDAIAQAQKYALKKGVTITYGKDPAAAAVDDPNADPSPDNQIGNGKQDPNKDEKK